MRKILPSRNVIHSTLGMESLMVFETKSYTIQGSNPARAYIRKILISNRNSAGWGTWIRTKDARVRAGSFTAKLSPNGCGRAHYHAQHLRASSRASRPRGTQVQI